jgi:hypothetical protein
MNSAVPVFGFFNLSMMMLALLFIPTKEGDGETSSTSLALSCPPPVTMSS